MDRTTEKILDLFLGGTNGSAGNSYTDGDTLFLHGNALARRTPEGIEVTTAGWNTATTKERLNGIPGCRVHTHRGQLYLNDKEWDGGWILLEKEE
jgi:hypothetical protein